MQVVRKTYTVPGPAVEGSEPLDQLARRISAYFKSNNYQVKEAGETITYEPELSPTPPFLSFPPVGQRAEQLDSIAPVVPILVTWDDCIPDVRASSELRRARETAGWVADGRETCRRARARRRR